MKILPTVIASTLLTACGSGGSGGGNDGGSTDVSRVVSSATVISSSSSSVAPTVVQEVVLTSQLEAMRDFEFNSSAALAFSLYDSQVHAKASALSICRADDQGNANLSDCLLKARLDERRLTSTLDIGNEVDQLVLTVYIFDQPLRIETATWDRAMGMQWDVNY